MGWPPLPPYSRQWSAWQTHSRLEAEKRPPRLAGFPVLSDTMPPGLLPHPVPGRYNGYHGRRPHIPVPDTFLPSGPSSPAAFHLSSTPAPGTVSADSVDLPFLNITCLLHPPACRRPARLPLLYAEGCCKKVGPIPSFLRQPFFLVLWYYACCFAFSSFTRAGTISKTSPTIP